MRKALLVMFAILSLTLGFAGTASAQSLPANDAAELCRVLDEAGVLDELGLTRGECVNLFKGPASENANNFIAAICGVESSQEFTGTSNKGQCIKVVKVLFEE